MCESGIRRVAASAVPSNVYRSNRSVKKQKAGGCTPALQGSPRWLPSEVDLAFSSVHLRSVHQRQQARNARRLCIGVDILSGCRRPLLESQQNQ
jgi:hypothetical protein